MARSLVTTLFDRIGEKGNYSYHQYDIGVYLPNVIGFNEESKRYMSKIADEYGTLDELTQQRTFSFQNKFRKELGKIIIDDIHKVRHSKSDGVVLFTGSQNADFNDANRDKYQAVDTGIAAKDNNLYLNNGLFIGGSQNPIVTNPDGSISIDDTLLDYIFNSTSATFNQDAIFNKGVSIKGSMGLTGGFTVDGATTLKDTLEVGKAATLKDTLNVTGATTLNDVLKVIKGVSFNDTLDVTGAVTLNDILKVTRATTLSDTLNVSKGATLKDTLDVIGATTLSDILKVVKATTLGDTLDVTGATTLKDTLEVGKTTTLKDTLDVTGATTLNDVLKVIGAVTLDNILSVTKATTLGDTLDVTGATTLKDTLNVTGATTLSDILKVIKAVTLNDTLEVTKDGTFKSNINVQGNINAVLSGNKYLITTYTDNDKNVIFQSDAAKNIFTGDIDIAGAISLSGAATLDSLTVNNDVEVKGNTNTKTLSTSDKATLDSLEVTNGANVNGSFISTKDSNGSYLFQLSSIDNILLSKFSTNKFEGNIVPNVTGSQNIGSTTLKWKNIYANTFTGDLSGNADTASKLKTPVDIKILGNNSTSVTKSFDGSANIEMDLSNLEWDASKLTSGVIDIDRLPKGALERMVPVKDQAARFALTSDDVQLGDTVYQEDTKRMYYVIDISSLGSDSGYREYTAGSATSVPWSGVTDKPAWITDPKSLVIKRNGTEIASYNVSEAKSIDIRKLKIFLGTSTSATEFDTSSDVSLTINPSAIGAAPAAGSTNITQLGANIILGKSSGTEGASIAANSDTYRQKITFIDNSTSGDDVFQFQQSTDAGSSFKTLMSIQDDGTVVATKFEGTFEGSASKLGTDTVGSGVKPMYLNAGVATASSSTVGAKNKPIFMNAGTLTASDDTIGSGTKPIFMNAGTLTASSSTVGAKNKPIFMNAGTLTASDDTIGSEDIPLFMKAGVLTASTKKFSDYLPLAGGTVSGDIIRSSSDKDAVAMTVKNSLANGALTVSAAGTFGLYSGGWLVYKDADGNIGLKGTATNASNLITSAGTAFPLTAAGNRFGVVPVVGSDGAMEVGNIIDFHLTDTDTSDYAARIKATSDGFTLSGTTSGTFKGNLTGKSTTTGAIEPTNLSSGSLDDLKPTNFTLYYAAGNNSIVNNPTSGGSAFGLFAYRISDGYRGQEALDSNGRKKIRLYNSSTWSDWRSVAYLDELVPKTGGTFTGNVNMSGGLVIPVLSTDPASPTAGQIWINTSA